MVRGVGGKEMVGDAGGKGLVGDAGGWGEGSGWGRTVGGAWCEGAVIYMHKVSACWPIHGTRRK